MHSVTCPFCGSAISISRFMPVSVTCKKCDNSFEVEYDPNELGFWGKRKLQYNAFSVKHPHIVKGVKAGIIACTAIAAWKFIQNSNSDTMQNSQSEETDDMPDDFTPAVPNSQMSVSEEPELSSESAQEVETPTPKTPFEHHLLERLAAGEFDGPVGSPCGNNHGSTIMYYIQDGFIKRFKQGPTKRVFDGEETEKVVPDWKNDRTLKTDGEKLNYLRRSGRYIDDSEVQDYSNKYWDDYWDKKHKS